MIQRVAERAKNLGFKDVIVATDSKEIFCLCEQTRIRVVMSLKNTKVGQIEFMKLMNFKKKNMISLLIFKVICLYLIGTCWMD